MRPQLRQIQTGGLKTSFGEKSHVVPQFSFPLHTIFISTSHFVTSLAKALVEAWHHGCMLWVLKRTHKEEVAETHAAVSFDFVSKRFALVCIMTSRSGLTRDVFKHIDCSGREILLPRSIFPFGMIGRCRSGRGAGSS